MAKKIIYEQRHQYWGADGIVWTKWYQISKDTPHKKYQGTGKTLLNEYREREIEE